MNKYDNEVLTKLLHTKETLELLRENNALSDFGKGMLACFQIHYSLHGDYEK